MKIIALYGETWSNTNTCSLPKYGRDTIDAVTLQIRYMYRYDVLDLNKNTNCSTPGIPIYLSLS